MQLHKYVFTDQQITSSVLEVKKNKSTYSLLSNPHKRIPQEQINKVFHSDDEGLVLYLENDSPQEALSLFVKNLQSQIDVYTHVANCLQKDVEKLMKGIIKIV